VGGYRDLIGPRPSQAVLGEMAFSSLQDPPRRVRIGHLLPAALHLRPLLRTHFENYFTAIIAQKQSAAPLREGRFGPWLYVPRFQAFLTLSPAGY
jgi:hypothetical protein